MPDIILEEGRCCPVCHGDGSDGQPTAQLIIEGETLGTLCPRCGAIGTQGEAYSPPEGPPEG